MALGASIVFLTLLVVREAMETLNSRGAACCARILQRTTSALSSWGVMGDNDDDDDEIFNIQRVGTETPELTKPTARVTNLREEDKTCRDRYLG